MHFLVKDIAYLVAWDGLQALHQIICAEKRTIDPRASAQMKLTTILRGVHAIREEVHMGTMQLKPIKQSLLVTVVALFEDNSFLRAQQMESGIRLDTAEVWSRTDRPVTSVSSGDVMCCARRSAHLGHRMPDVGTILLPRAT